VVALAGDDGVAGTGCFQLDVVAAFYAVDGGGNQPVIG